MKKKLYLIICAIVLVCITEPVMAKSKTYIYRNRAEWVKLVDLSNKQMAGQVLLHPNTSLTVENMQVMLESLRMNKAELFKKGFKTNDVFSKEEASKLAPFIVKALANARPNQVVNVSVIHKRPYFIVRQDYVSVINIYVKEDGAHFYFAKLFAKLEGDYKQASEMYKAIRKAKSLRVSLSAQKGQVISAGGQEIIVKSEIQEDRVSPVQKEEDKNLSK